MTTGFSASLVDQDQNPLAITFNLTGINMGDIRKVIIPKGHEIGEHVPLAKLLLNDNEAYDRVEMTQMNGQVSMTLCLDAAVKSGNPDFTVTAEHKEIIEERIRQLFDYIQNNRGHFGNPFHPGCLVNHFEPVSTLTADKITDPDERAVFEAATHILNPMAAQHGGSFEVVSLQGGELELIVFGSCSGCTSFDLTYGQSPRKINNKLEETTPSCQLEVTKVKPTENPQYKNALVFV